MSVQARCSRCEFTRRFSDGLAGRFYRCPKCKKGVIAVPADVSESEELPLRLSSSSMENPFLAVAKRMPAGQKETMGMTLTGSTAEGTLVDADGPSGPRGKKARGGRRGDTLEDSVDAVPKGKVDELKATLLDPRGDKPPVKHKGEVATARRILVECGLCGFLVRIPAEFFGKTVHCPECAGNTIFSESTLDPVKDEIIDRLVMETQERRVLFPKPGMGSSLSEVLESMKRSVGNNALKSFLLGVGLGLLVLLAVWGVVQGQRASARQAFVLQAQRDGWRYATAIEGGSDLFHEPWCTELEAGSGRRISNDEFQQSGDSIRLHDCE